MLDNYGHDWNPSTRECRICGKSMLDVAVIQKQCEGPKKEEPKKEEPKK